ncbi:unnamed protein product [Cuscuta epithymum]|uniref:Uncharacterized protein n=1 Tax=Cuscuta epithymum TaxID=186058 RepID=A0AAV0EEE7_9ASTE|nr:unnamed protein product [Cuscuta epithymum]
MNGRPWTVRILNILAVLIILHAISLLLAISIFRQGMCNFRLIHRRHGSRKHHFPAGNVQLSVDSLSDCRSIQGMLEMDRKEQPGEVRTSALKEGENGRSQRRETRDGD